MKYIDLSLTINKNLPTWPGEEFTLTPLTKYGFIKDESLHAPSLHIGTHIDAPIHMIEGGKKLSEFEPDKFIGDGVLIDVRSHATVDIDLLYNKNLTQNSIVLLYSGCDKKIGTPEFLQQFPIVTEAFAHELVKHNVKMIGIDWPTPDIPPFPVHKILLGHEILIIELMTNLDQLLNIQNFTVIALPPKLETAGGPIRAIAQYK
ncbi:cyclase family protein [bacterium]|nr:cyclase family protein [bacterium]NBX77917.1 cyclase family protein [bacterium]